MSAIARLRALARRPGGGPGAGIHAHAPRPDAWPPELAALGVAIGPVHPETWPRCERLLACVHGVEALPVTWLVAPPAPEAVERTPEWYRRVLTEREQVGDELAWMAEPACAHPAPTADPLDPESTAAAARVTAAMVWFWGNGWRVSGYLPANDQGDGPEWNALTGSVLAYTIIRGRLHLLGSGVSVPVAQGGLGTLAAMRRAVTRVPERDATIPLARVVLHPDDLGRPTHIGRALRLIDTLRVLRWPMTHAAFARRLARHVASRALALP